MDDFIRDWNISSYVERLHTEGDGPTRRTSASRNGTGVPPGLTVQAETVNEETAASVAATTIRLIGRSYVPVPPVPRAIYYICVSDSVSVFS